MSLTTAEIDYFATQPLAPLATVGTDGQPDIVPVTVEFGGTGFYLRLTPTVSWSSNMESEPVAARRALR